MDLAIAAVAVLGGFAAVLGAFAALAARARTRKAGAAFMGPLDEIYNPAAHRARIEIHEQAEHAAPMPTPDDKAAPLRSRPAPGSTEPK